MCDTKHCRKCGQTKPNTEFSRCRANKDGLQRQCKACAKASNKAWREANRDKSRASSRTWYEANKGRKAATDKAHYQANKERKVAYNKAWREANKDRVAATNKAWREANREHRQAHKAKSRAIKLGIDGPHFTAEQWKEKLQQHRHTCYYCGKPDGKLEVDHVVPLSDPSSSNAIDNVVPCCAGCNRRKQDRPVEVFMAELKSCQCDCPTNPAQEVN